MRNIYIIAVTIFSLNILYGCNSINFRIEKSIAEFVQTDKNGNKSDLDFKLLELGDPQNMTVADSVKFLSDHFEKEKARKIEVLQDYINEYKATVKNEKYSSFKKAYSNNIKKFEYQLDSIKNTSVQIPEKYRTADKNEILAIKVKCRFSITTIFHMRQDVNATFILSPDGDKCYKKIANK